MSPPVEPTKIPSRRRALLAGLIVVLTMIGVWKFIDYRLQPPPPPPQAGKVARESRE